MGLPPPPTPSGQTHKCIVILCLMPAASGETTHLVCVSELDACQEQFNRD